MIQRRNSDLDLEEKFTRESNRLEGKQLDRIAEAYCEMLGAIGEDVEREGLRRTPDRAARALEFLTQGYRQDLDEIINDAVLSRMRVRSFWLRTLSFIHCASIICCPLSVGRTLPTFQM